MKRILLIALLMPTTAIAHPGHGFGVAEGLLHPLTGADHLLAMVGVGLWAALQTGAARWAMPLSFLAAMACAFAVGLTLPLVQPAILASVIVLGAAVSMAVRAPLGLVLPLVALMGLAHGAAHGLEGSGAGFGLGMILATAALHALGTGLGLGLGLGLNRYLLRAGGALTLAAGLGLAIAG